MVSSVARAHRGDLRWSAELRRGDDRAPSLLRFAPTIIALLAVVISSSDLADPDLWRHLRFGADMIARGGVLRVDPYSYAIPSLPWVSHEWLSEVILAWTFARFGVIGLKLLRFACSAVTIALLAAAVAETRASLNIQLGVMILLAIGLTPEMQFRPQLFTYAMLSVTIWLLTRDNYRRRAPLWVLVPMLALWANMHGGFVIGIAALGVYSTIVAVEDVYARSRFSRSARLTAIAAAAIFATLLTPFGAATWESTMRTVWRPPMLSQITEWQSLIAGMAAVWHLRGLTVLFDAALVLMFGGLIVTLAIAPRGNDAPLVGVAALMIAATFTALRNIPLGVIASAAPLARHWSLAMKRVRGASTSTISADAHASVATQAIIGIIAIALALKTGVVSRKLEPERKYPAGAIAFMQANALSGNILCDYEWAGYVLYHTAPASQVFIDGRFEMIYPERIAHDFVDFYDAHSDASHVLDSYPHDFVLLSPNAPAQKIMDARRDWILIYRDDAGLLYARGDSPAARLPGIPVAGHAPPFTFP
jgi:hypothetical protein